MAGKITSFLREIKLGLSIVFLIIGLIVFILSMLYWFANDYSFEFINEIGNWNAFLVPVGFILLLVGVYYLYAYLRDKKFIMSEIDTNKRSEFLKRHNELKNRVKHMPKKYQKMLIEKEEELKIK